MLDIFALIVLFVLAGAAIAVFITIGRIPGDLARRDGHPQAEAINLLAWFGLLAGGLGWVLALIWSRTRLPGDSSAALDRKIAELEARVAELEGAKQ